MVMEAGNPEHCRTLLQVSRQTQQCQSHFILSSLEVPPRFLSQLGISFGEDFLPHFLSQFTWFSPDLLLGVIRINEEALYLYFQVPFLTTKQEQRQLRVACAPVLIQAFITKQ